MGAHFVIFDEASGGEVDMDFCPGQLGRIFILYVKRYLLHCMATWVLFDLEVE